MIERLGIALALAAFGWLAGRGINRYLLAQRARRGLGLDEYRPGRPAILYFTAPGCAPCETIQRPALEELAVAFGQRLQVIEVDATLRPDLADSWGVLSVPTTFIIDTHGRPGGVNHGAVRADRLAAQLAQSGEVPTDATRAARRAPVGP